MNQRVRITDVHVIQNQTVLLDVLSQGGRSPELHSTCSFCAKENTAECPTPGVKKLGVCTSYKPIDGSKDVIEQRVMDYLMHPNLEALTQ